MAKQTKREECHFDTDGFIADFRKDAVPSYHTAADVETAPPASDKPPQRLKKNQPEQSKSSVWSDSEDYDTLQKYQDLDMSASEIEYIKEYVVKGTFRQVNQNGRRVLIREKFHTRIKNILELLGEDANMATYIDNVLAEHFKKYFPTIMGIAKKCPPKF